MGNIQKEELRIGNFIKFSHLQGNVIQIRHDSCEINAKKIVIRASYEELEPIPLTEEILLKCGFEKQMAWTFSIDLMGNIKFIYYLGEKGWSLGNKNYSDFSNLKYLHQLQNLYFALTGEELTVNL